MHFTNVGKECWKNTIHVQTRLTLTIIWGRSNALVSRSIKRSVHRKCSARNCWYYCAPGESIGNWFNLRIYWFKILINNCSGKNAEGTIRSRGRLRSQTPGESTAGGFYGFTILDSLRKIAPLFIRSVFPRWLLENSHFFFTVLTAITACFCFITYKNILQSNIFSPLLLCIPYCSTDLQK